jgi:hypothetical protein
MKVIKGGSYQEDDNHKLIKNAFLAFIKVFLKSPKELMENYHVGIIAWNLANSHIVTGMDKKALLDSTNNASILSKKEMNQVSKMVDYKLSNFPDLLHLIKSLEFDFSDDTMETFSLEIVTIDEASAGLDEFMDEEDYDEDDYDDENNFFEGFIKRSGIVVKPKRNFGNFTDASFKAVEWSMYLFDDVSEFDVDDDIKKVAKPWLEDIVIHEAEKYNLSFEGFNKVTFKYFEANFDYMFVPDVYDLLAIPVDKH